MIDAADELSASSVTLIGGGHVESGYGLHDARRCLRDAVGELLPYSNECGINLALEPIHPMLASLSCLTSFHDGVQFAHEFDGQLKLKLDTFHTWWDSRLGAATSEAGDLIVDFQVSDWLVPGPMERTIRRDRGMVGEGLIDFTSYIDMLNDIDYKGRIEFEVLSREKWWHSSPSETVEAVLKAFKMMHD
jgi:sugar phosphate isomerase/epimerase